MIQRGFGVQLENGSIVAILGPIDMPRVVVLASSAFDAKPLSLEDAKKHLMNLQHFSVEVVTSEDSTIIGASVEPGNFVACFGAWCS
jgi:hypothetical protein